MAWALDSGTWAIQSPHVDTSHLERSGDAVLLNLIAFRFYSALERERGVGRVGPAARRKQPYGPSVSARVRTDRATEVVGHLTVSDSTVQD